MTEKNYYKEFKNNFYRTIQFYAILLLALGEIYILFDLIKSLNEVLIMNKLFLASVILISFLLWQYSLWYIGQVKIRVNDCNIKIIFPYSQKSVKWEDIKRLRRVWVYFSGIWYFVDYEGGSFKFPSSIENNEELIEIIQEKSNKEFKYSVI